MECERPDHFSSSVQEKVLEHQFVAALSGCLWRQGLRDIEVLRSEVDAFGHDLVIEANGVLRHIQLKASGRSSKTARVNINTSLVLKPSGCVVWFLYDPATLELGPFRWLGAEPGAPIRDLGDRIARHSKGNRNGYKGLRRAIRAVPKADFTTVATIEDLAFLLFGRSF